MSGTQGSGIVFDFTRVYANLFDEVDVQAPKLGQVVQDRSGNIFKFVKDLSTVLGAIGDWACSSYANGVTKARTEINTPATGKLHLLAGVKMGAFGNAAFPFGWIQCFGVGRGLVTSSASHAIGTSVKVTNAGGVAAVFDAAVDTLPVFHNHAVMLATFNPGGNAVTDLFINCENGI